MAGQWSIACSACGVPLEIDHEPRPNEFARHWLCPGRVAASQPSEASQPSAAPPAHDSVNRPPHYTQGKVECIDAIEAALGADGLRAFCRGNAIKYLWRAGAKGDEVEDLRKARWYLEREIASRAAATPGAAS